MFGYITLSKKSHNSGLPATLFAPFFLVFCTAKDYTCPQPIKGWWVIGQKKGAGPWTTRIARIVTAKLC